MAQRTGTVQISNLDPLVTATAVTISGSTVAGQSPITINSFAGQSFQCNDGDVLIETATQTTPGGTSQPSAPIEIVVAAGTVTPTPPTTPATPVIASNTFV